MQTVNVKTNKPYNVYIGTGLLPRLAEFLPGDIKIGKAVLVSDDNVAPLYAEVVTKALKSAGFSVHTFIIPHGETSKCQAQLFKLLEFMAEHHVNRADCMFALGGGVVGDLTGFAASIYLRGVPFVQLPTTVLAACDSSVGGKTAIDLPAGKNLVGSFYQPRAVICDYSTFDTLPKAIFSDGMAEVIKYGMLTDRALLDTLNGDISVCLEQVLARCVQIKADIVEQDTFDTTVRQLLNFGHTVGHAIEAASEYTLPHGSAVAIGMAIISRGCAALGMCHKDVPDTLLKLLNKYALPHRCNYTAEALYKITLHDKKSTADGVQLIVPTVLGKCVIAPTASADVLRIIKAGLE